MFVSVFTYPLGASLQQAGYNAPRLRQAKAKHLDND